MLKDKVKFYKDNAGEWRWSRLNMGNYREVGASSEGYKNYRDCYANAHGQFGITVDYDRPTFDESGDPPPTELVVDDD